MEGGRDALTSGLMTPEVTRCIPRAVSLYDDLLPLGNAVRDAREAKGWTQEELAHRVGVSRATMSLLESAQIKWPKVAMLQAIATALDVPVGGLLALAGVEPSQAIPGQLHWLVSQLDEGNVRRLVRIGHALLQDQHEH